jgi:hypothetical protein
VPRRRRPERASTNAIVWNVSTPKIARQTGTDVPSESLGAISFSSAIVTGEGPPDILWCIFHSSPSPSTPWSSSSSLAVLPASEVLSVAETSGVVGFVLSSSFTALPSELHSARNGGDRSTKEGGVLGYFEWRVSLGWLYGRRGEDRRRVRWQLCRRISPSH